MGEIKVPPEFEELIDGLVSSGRYASPSDVLRASLTLLDQQERERASRIEELRRKIDEGIAAADRGDVVDGGEVFAEMRQRLGLPPA